MGRACVEASTRNCPHKSCTHNNKYSHHERLVRFGSSTRAPPKVSILNEEPLPIYLVEIHIEVALYARDSCERIILIFEGCTII